MRGVLKGFCFYINLNSRMHRDITGEGGGVWSGSVKNKSVS